MTKARVLGVILALFLVITLSNVAFAATNDVADLVSFNGMDWYVLEDTDQTIKLIAQNNVVGGAMGIQFGGTGDYIGSDVQQFLDGSDYQDSFSAKFLNVIEEQTFTVYKYASQADFYSNKPLDEGAESVSSKFRLLDKTEFDALSDAEKEIIFKDSDGINHYFFMSGLGTSGQVFCAYPVRPSGFAHIWVSVSDPMNEYEVLPVMVLDWDNVEQVGNKIFPKNAAHDSTLASLEISVGSLSPAFKPEVTEYFVHIWNTKEIEISAVAAAGDIKAGSDLGLKALERGDNIFEITVVAICGEATHETTYTIKVVLSDAPLLTVGGNTESVGFPAPETISVPIKFSHTLAELADILNVSSAGYWFTITYDTDMLEFAGYKGDTSNPMLIFGHNAEDGPGTIRVTYVPLYSFNLLNTDTIYIPFNVVGNPVRGDETVLELSTGTVMDDDLLPYEYVEYLPVTVIFKGAPRILGDVNEDGQVTVEDAISLLQWLVGLETPGIIWDEETLWAANVKGYGSPDISDAALILRMAVGG